MKRAAWVGAALTVTLTVALAGAARAQGGGVGYAPEQSPFRDVDSAHEVSLLFGGNVEQRDPARVAPHGGLITGLHYQWRASGPATLYTEVARIGSTRMVIDPTKTAAARNLGEQDWPMYALDLGLAMALTGGKSWHHLVPQVNAGAGLVSDLKSGTDLGGFKFGTRFALNWGAGVRWVPAGRWGVRADLQNRLYTVAYPNSYFTGSTPVFTNPSQPKSGWTNHAALTIGIAYNFFGH